MGWTLVQTQTAGDDSEIDFTINDDYDEIMFVVTNYKPATNEKGLEWQVITGDDSGYDRAIQSGNYRLAQNLGDNWFKYSIYDDSPNFWQHSSDAAWHRFGGPPAEGSATTGTGGDAAAMNNNGQMTIYRPQETAHWKHFNLLASGTYTRDGTEEFTWSFPMRQFGYIKELDALTGIRFRADTGNISVGTFSMYGLS